VVGRAQVAGTSEDAGYKKQTGWRGEDGRVPHAKNLGPGPGQRLILRRALGRARSGPGPGCEGNGGRVPWSARFDRVPDTVPLRFDTVRTLWPLLASAAWSAWTLECHFPPVLPMHLPCRDFLDFGREISQLCIFWFSMPCGGCGHPSSRETGTAPLPLHQMFQWSLGGSDRTPRLPCGCIH
jgi:hypothetical protein